MHFPPISRLLRLACILGLALTLTACDQASPGTSPPVQSPAVGRTTGPAQQQSPIARDSTAAATIPQSLVARDTLALDFAHCEGQREIVQASLGSTIYELIGPEGEVCVLKYGGKIGNSESQEALRVTCRVPRSMAIQHFSVTDYGVDFSPLLEFCTF